MPWWSKVYICLNGDIVAKGEAKISPFDHGYMYGLGVFETFRIYEKHPFLFLDHIERLQEGLSELNIDVVIDSQKILDDVERLLNANELSSAYVRLNFSAGVGEIGLQVEPYHNPTYIIYMKPLEHEVQFPEKEAIILTTKRNSPEGKERLKSHHYLNNILGKREIGDDSNKEGLFLNEEGFFTEGIVSNLFWIKNGILYTPSVDTGILNGITRQFVLKLAESIGVDTEVGYYHNEVLYSDEAFITNSIQEIVPLKTIEGKTFPGAEGPITKKLMGKYRSLTRTLWTKADL
jgi:4-amino-4-deoxychorismate lyase